MSNTAALLAEVKTLANDLKTKSMFSLGDDIPLVADVMLKSAALIQALDARMTALEAHFVPPAVPQSGGSIDPRLVTTPKEK